MLQGQVKKQESVRVFHLGAVLSIWQKRVSWESSPSELERSVLTDRKRENICVSVCACVSEPLRVHMCWCVHVCLYAVYSEQLGCQTGV